MTWAENRNLSIDGRPVSPGGEALVPEPSKEMWLKEISSNTIGTPFVLGRAKLLQSEIDEVFDIGAIGVKLAESHSPLVPHILKGMEPLLPGVSLSTNELAFKHFDEDSSWGKEDALEVIAAQYGRYLGEKGVNLFFSGGWDSRVELALVLQRIDPDCVTLYHFFEDSKSLEAVTEISKRKRVRLEIILREDRHADLFQSLDASFWESCLKEPFWRPTVPRFANLVTAEKRENIFLGYTPWELKGRYSSRMPVMPPSDTKSALWRLRIITPLAGIVDGQAAKDAIQLQIANWIRAERLTRFLRDDIRQDYANFALSYGFSYAHRMRMLGGVGLDQVSAKWGVVVPFWRLSRKDKEGTEFIRFLLGRVDPELLRVPIISSSTDALSKTQVDFHDDRTRVLRMLRVTVTRLEEYLSNDEHERLRQSQTSRVLRNIANEHPHPGVQLVALQIYGFILKCLSSRTEN